MCLGIDAEVPRLLPHKMGPSFLFLLLKHSTPANLSFLSRKDCYNGGPMSLPFTHLLHTIDSASIALNVSGSQPSSAAVPFLLPQRALSFQRVVTQPVMSAPTHRHSVSRLGSHFFSVSRNLQTYTELWYSDGLSIPPRPS
jgi:hypothetical protein